MAKLYKVKNISNRTIELVFGESSERIEPRKTGKPHSESEWNGSFAKEQAELFESRHEARIIVEDDRPIRNVQPQETVVTPANDGNKETNNNNKKGAK